MESTAIDREAIRNATRDVYEAGSYQRELPTPAEAREAASSPFFEWLASLFAYGSTAFWVLVITVAAVIVIWLALKLMDRYGASIEQRDATTPNGAGSVSVSTRPLANAQRLAEQQEYAAAIHVLLLATIEELCTKLQYEPSPAFTSREILSDCSLSDRSSAALSELIRRVELHYFGTRPPELADYELCVTQFRTFQEACAS
ncbi:MAG: hypothetical protein AAF581_14020 [Planctomycetota bacterium]